MSLNAHPPAPLTSGQGLLDALFDFEALPGRYPLILREPRILFDHGFEVLQLAAERELDGLALEPNQATRAHRAARYFVRTALMRSGTDHYTLLGLPRDFTADTLRSHYRLLIRLTHPDFVTTSGTWPADAATRINLANDVLSSVPRRAGYDRRLRVGAAPLGGLNSASAVLPRPVRLRWPRYLAWGGAGLAVLALTVTWQQWPAPTQGVPLAELVPSARPTDLKPTQPVSVAAPSNAPTPTPMAAAPIGSKPVASVLAVTSVPLKPAVLAASPGIVADGLRRTIAVAEPRTVTVTATVPKAPPQIPAVAMVASELVDRAETRPRAIVPTEINKIKAAELPEPVVRPPTLADAQLAMGQLIAAMQAGRGDALLRTLERPVSHSEGAAELVQAYNHLIGNSRQIRLGPVQLLGRPQADQLAVDGIVQLLLQDQGAPAPVIELRLRAKFIQRGGRAVMTELAAGGSRP